MLLASFFPSSSPILHFDKNGSLAPCVKKTSSFFQFCFESGLWGYPTEQSTGILFLCGIGWGKLLWGALRKRGNRGVKFTWR